MQNYNNKYNNTTGIVHKSQKPSNPNGYPLNFGLSNSYVFLNSQISNQTTMQRTTPIILSIILLAIIASLVFCCTPQCPLRIMPSRTTRSTQEAAKHRQDDEAMAAVILRKEKNSAKMMASKRQTKMIRTQLKLLSLWLSLLPLRPISPLFSPVMLARK